MSRASKSTTILPPAAVSALKRLGENLAIARSRRRESQRLWATRLGVSIPTLIRLEQGDPRVAMGVYATSLWMLGQIEALAKLADPQQDQGALDRDVRAAVERRASRSAASALARAGRK